MYNEELRFFNNVIHIEIRRESIHPAPKIGCNTAYIVFIYVLHILHLAPHECYYSVYSANYLSDIARVITVYTMLARISIVKHGGKGNVG